MKIRHPPKIIPSDSGFPLPTEVSLQFLLKEEFTSDEADEFSNSLTKNSRIPSSSILLPGESSDADWDDKDDACFLEATEDAEFADAADRSLLGDEGAMDDIPDELIMEALQSS